MPHPRTGRVQAPSQFGQEHHGQDASRKLHQLHGPHSLCQLPGRRMVMGCGLLWRGVTVWERLCLKGETLEDEGCRRCAESPVMPWLGQI